MYSEKVLTSLVNRLYEAMLDAGQWPTFLSDLAGAISGTLPTLFSHDSRLHKGALGISVGYDANVIREYQDHFAERNPWLRGGSHLLVAGKVRTSHMMCSRKDFLRSEFNHGYCRSLGISQGIGATILNNSTGTSNIALFAGNGRPAFDRQEIQLLSALLPHLRQALRVHIHVTETDIRQRGLLEIIDQLKVGIMLVAAGGRVLLMNSAAQRVVAARDGLFVDRTGLRSCRSSETLTLRALIGTASQTSARRGLHSGGVMRITRPNGKPALEVLVSPISTGDSGSLVDRAVAAIYVTDPAQIQETSEAFLVRLHGLTASEAKVAALIVRGRSASQAAHELGISYNTIKSHLKRVFVKTGTKRQGDLIRFLARGLVMWSDHSAQNDAAK